MLQFRWLISCAGSRDISVGIKVSYGPGPTESHIQFIPEIKRPGPKIDYTPPTIVDVKNGGAIPPPSINLHGVALN
jgi:hypothetical protein